MLSPRSKKVLGLNPPPSTLRSLHVLPVAVSVLSGYSELLPQPTGLTGKSKLDVCVTDGCLSLCVSSMIDSGPVQGVPRLSQG